MLDETEWRVFDKLHKIFYQKPDDMRFSELVRLITILLKLKKKIELNKNDRNDLFFLEDRFETDPAEMSFPDLLRMIVLLLARTDNSGPTPPSKRRERGRRRDDDLGR